MNVEVVYQADEAYAGVLDVALYSLLKSNYKISFSVTILDDGLSENTRRFLKETAISFDKKIQFISANEINQFIGNTNLSRYEGFRKNTHSYLKLIYPKICSNRDRILYLDCDTLTVGYIADLMELELDGAVAAMALDSTVDSKYKTKIGLEATDPYFNSGVMLIDVEKWQHQNILDKIQNLANSGRRFNTVDQDYVNIALLGKCKTISNKFNFQPFHKRYTPKQYLSVYQKKSLYYDMQELIDAEDDIRLIHFFRYLGMHPWDMKSMHPFEKEFIYYRDKVPKASFQMMTPNNLTLTIRIERGLYKILPKVSFLRAFRMAHNRMLEK